MPDPCKPLITAHSGCENSTENTVESVIAGIEAGADAVEIDIRTSFDGVPVLIHDPFMEDSIGNRMYISAHTCAELQNFARKGPGEPTSLEDILSEVRQRKCMLNLDLKDIDSIDYVRRSIVSFGLLNYVIISGCDVLWAKEIMERTPKLQVLLNAYREPDMLDLQAYRTYVDDLARSVSETGCRGINIDYTMCRPFLMEYARKRFLPVSVWTVDRQEDMRAMLKMGVFAITTYYPGKLRQLMEADDV